MRTKICTVKGCKEEKRDGDSLFCTECRDRFRKYLGGLAYLDKVNLADQYILVAKFQKEGKDE